MLQEVFRGALLMLVRHPRLFLPRLVMAAIWSVFWIRVMQFYSNPLAVTPAELLLMGAFVLVFVPLQIWVFNAYVMMVQQYETTGINMVRGFIDGAKRLPHAIAVFGIVGAIAGVIALPGAAFLLYGLLYAQFTLQVVGAVWVALALLLTSVVTYFAPVSVVLGGRRIVTDMRTGIEASAEERRIVLALSILSFSMLLMTQLLEQGLQEVGIAGFFIGRLVVAVISVYVLVMNPELFLQVQNE